jgi:predicted methyltransferase
MLALKPILHRSTAGLLLTMVLSLPVALAESTPAAAPDPALARAIANPDRTPRFALRDSARHPAEELAFFGLRPDMTVVEIWPGGGYWTEILAPNGEENASIEAWTKRYDAPTSAFGPVKITNLGRTQFDIAPAGSADLVLTFRNLHNWMYEGYSEQALAAAFKALKPGGVLGIEEHRGRTDKPQDPKAENGYVREDFSIALAEKVGFKLLGKSEINANPKDTKDWVDGVWTLPPTLSQGDRDREKYVAIGEADNYVLKFVKPRG